MNSQELYRLIDEIDEEDVRSMLCDMDADAASKKKNRKYTELKVFNTNDEITKFLKNVDFKKKQVSNNNKYGRETKTYQCHSHVDCPYRIRYVCHHGNYSVEHSGTHGIQRVVSKRGIDPLIVHQVDMMLGAGSKPNAIISELIKTYGTQEIATPTPTQCPFMLMAIRHRLFILDVLWQSAKISNSVSVSKTMTNCSTPLMKLYLD